MATEYMVVPKEKLLRPEYFESGLSIANNIDNALYNNLNPYATPITVPKDKFSTTKESGLSIRNQICYPNPSKFKEGVYTITLAQQWSGYIEYTDLLFPSGWDVVWSAPIGTNIYAPPIYNYPRIETFDNQRMFYPPPETLISRGVVMFDTSAIVTSSEVTSTILSAKLHLAGGVAWQENLDASVVVQHCTYDYPTGFSTYWFNKALYTGNGGSIKATALPSYIELNADGLSWINQNTTTMFALRLDSDIDQTGKADPFGDGERKVARVSLVPSLEVEFRVENRNYFMVIPTEKMKSEDKNNAI